MKTIMKYTNNVIDLDASRLYRSIEKSQKRLEPIAEFINNKLNIPTDSYKYYEAENKENFIFVVFDIIDLRVSNFSEKATWSAIAIYAGTKRLLSVNMAYTKQEGAQVINCSLLLRNKMKMKNCLDNDDIRQICSTYIKYYILPELEG